LNISSLLGTKRRLPVNNKKLRLRATTVRVLDPESAANVRGGWTSIWSCEIQPQTKAFTNCEYCPEPHPSGVSCATEPHVGCCKAIIEPL
jgi:hypothetical protein